MKGPFLEFLEEPSAGRVTRIWSAVSTVTGKRVGFIQWHAPWRRYTFQTERDFLVLDAVCALELATFLELQMGERAAARRRERAA